MRTFSYTYHHKIKHLKRKKQQHDTAVFADCVYCVLVVRPLFAPIISCCRPWSAPSCSCVRRQIRAAANRGPVRRAGRWKTASLLRVGGMRAAQF